MSWRWAGWSAGVVLLIVSGLVLLLQVSVTGAGTQPRACGSAWDVVAGRAGWPAAQDLRPGGRDIWPFAGRWRAQMVEARPSF